MLDSWLLISPHKFFSILDCSFYFHFAVWEESWNFFDPKCLVKKTKLGTEEHTGKKQQQWNKNIYIYVIQFHAHGLSLKGVSVTQPKTYFNFKNQSLFLTHIFTCRGILPTLTVSHCKPVMGIKINLINRFHLMKILIFFSRNRPKKQCKIQTKSKQLVKSNIWTFN